MLIIELDYWSRNSFNTAKQSASDSIILEYLLRPVLHAMYMYARESVFFFNSVIHRLVPCWGLDLCVEKRRYFRDKECSLISCWINSKCECFYDLELLLNWDGHPSKEGNAQASGVRLRAVLRGVSAGGNLPLDQKWGFELSFHITPILWCSGRSGALFQGFHLEWNPGPLKSVTKLT